MCLFLFAAGAKGEPECPLVFQYLRPHVVRPQQDTSVELELPMSKELLAVLTTENNRLSPLLKDLDPPSWLVEEIGRYLPNREPETLRQAPWDLLSLPQKFRLLQYVAASRNSQKNFYRNRTFDGLVVREKVSVFFGAPTRVLGKLYPPGTHQIPIGELIKKVEHGAPHGADKAASLELHLRAGGPEGPLGLRLSAGKVSEGASELLEALGISPPHQHAHIVSALPKEELAKGPFEVAKTTDFFRRTNLALEMIAIVEYGHRIEAKKVEGITYWDHLSREKIGGVFDYFTSVSEGRETPIGDRFKMGYAGMRGSDKYVSPVPLWGIEVRFIPKGANRDAHRRVLDGIQASMEKRSYGLDEGSFSRWWEEAAKGDPKGALTNAWWDKPWSGLAADAPPEIRRTQQGNPGEWLKRSGLETLGVETPSVKMLLHNWSKDPLVYGNRELDKGIQVAQGEALQKIRRGDPTHQVVREFLMESGLYQATLQSIGPR